jgi:hypothetical protein
MFMVYCRLIHYEPSLMLPMYPERQLLHVPAVFKQCPLCNTEQLGALLQSTVLIVEATYHFEYLMNPLRLDY